MCKVMSELEKAVADYRSLKAMKEEVEAQLKAAEDEIYSYLEHNNKTAEIGSDFSIKVSMCQRTTIDTKRLEADLGSLTDYQRISQYRRLYVK